MKQCLALALVLMLTASCVIQPMAYDPAGEETRVAYAVRATMGAPTPGATAARRPTRVPATPTRTPRPTPTPEVIYLPEDWVEYTTRDGTLSLWHPASWEILSEDPDGATFAAGDAAFWAAVVDDDWCGRGGSVDGMAAMDCAADAILRASGSESGASTRVTRKEVCDFGGRSGYVLEFEARSGYVRGHACLMAVTLEPGLMAVVVGFALDKHDLEDLDLVVTSAYLVGDDGSGTWDDRGANRVDQAATGDFEVTDWSWYTDPRGAYVIVDGVIENTSRRPIRHVQVLIATYDSDHKLLSTDSGYADLDYLAPGRSTTFKVMTPNLGGGVAWVRIVSLEGQWAD